MVSSLTKRLEEQDIALRISEEAQTWIAEQAYDPIYGARPIKRFLIREVETPLAKEILSGRVMPKSLVTVALKDNALAFESVVRED